MPACDRVNDRNTPMAYSGIRAVTLAWKTMISTEATIARDDDAARVDQPAAAVGQLARQEAIAGMQSAQPREIGKGGVGGHDQDDRRGGDGGQVQKAGPAAVDRARQLRDDRLRLGWDRADVRQPGT